jgi:glutamate N-acetyltransferase/amino-acid N-acetyltransferase
MLAGDSTERSFNAVTVDDHMSTNDTACLLAPARPASAIARGAALKSFGDALDEVCRALAYQIAADGEGATKVVAITVRRRSRSDRADDRPRDRQLTAGQVRDARQRPELGPDRLAPPGSAGVPFDPDRAMLKLQGTVVFRAGRPLTFDARARE